MRHVGDTREGTWPAEPWGSISGRRCSGTGAESWGQTDSSSQKALDCPGRGPLAALPLCCLLPARQCPVGSWKSRGAPEAALRTRQGAAGAVGWVGWDGMGSMSDMKHPQPHGPLGDRWQCLHVLLASTATRDLAFLVQEVNDSAQHSHHQDGHDDGHDDHPLALCC